MATKIINILRDDSFEEIFDIFQNATAEEVIFVLPKKSKAFSKETHFTELAKAAKTSGKRISLLSSNAQAAAMGRAYNFEVLTNESPTATRKKTPAKAKAKLTALKEPDIEREFVDVRDDSDAFERDVVVPSDETVVPEDESEEKEDKELEGAGSEEQSATADENTGQDEEEEKAEVKQPEDDVQEDEELTQSKTPAAYEIIPAVSAVSKKTVETAKSPVTEKQLNEFERTWKEEVSNANIWNEPAKKQKEGFLGGLFLQKTEPLPQSSFVVSKPDKKSSRKALLLLFFAALLVLGGIVFISSGSAQVSIKPAEKKLDFTLQVSTSDKYATIDPAFNKLPGQLFSVTRTVTRIFQTTGKKEVAQKARGKIVIYNEYGPTAQTLIATTRFETPDGLIFRTLRTVSVPGTSVENGKTVPGQTEVEIIADKPGQTYNITPTKFTLPAFKERGDTARYEKIYARSTQPISGGASGTSQVVTELDFSTAQDAIKEDLQKEIKDALASETNDLIVPKIFGIEISKLESTAQVDEAANEFTVNATGSIKTVAFKETDFNELLKKYIDKNYNLMFIPDRVKVEYKETSFDDARGVLDMQLGIAGVGYAKLDEQKILQDLLGKRQDNIRDYLKGTVGVASARVILSPFWVRKMPNDKDKIKFEISY